jgi:hypothetical protein
VQKKKLLTIPWAARPAGALKPSPTSFFTLLDASSPSGRASPFRPKFFSRKIFFISQWITVNEFLLLTPIRKLVAVTVTTLILVNVVFRPTPAAIPSVSHK